MGSRSSAGRRRHRHAQFGAAEAPRDSGPSRPLRAEFQAYRACDAVPLPLRHLRDVCLERTNCAKRLECAGFSGAVGWAERLEWWMFPVRTKSGAEVTADAPRVPAMIKFRKASWRMFQDFGALARADFRLPGRGGGGQ